MKFVEIQRYLLRFFLVNMDVFEFLLSSQMRKITSSSSRHLHLGGKELSHAFLVVGFQLTLLTLDWTSSDLVSSPALIAYDLSHPNALKSSVVSSMILISKDTRLRRRGSLTDDSPHLKSTRPQSVAPFRALQHNFASLFQSSPGVLQDMRKITTMKSRS